MWLYLYHLKHLITRSAIYMKLQNLKKYQSPRLLTTKPKNEWKNTLRAAEPWQNLFLLFDTGRENLHCFISLFCGKRMFIYYALPGCCFVVLTQELYLRQKRNITTSTSHLIYDRIEPPFQRKKIYKTRRFLSVELLSTNLLINYMSTDNWSAW